MPFDKDCPLTCALRLECLTGTDNWKRCLKGSVWQIIAVKKDENNDRD
jgi:hypothetical protein